MQLIRGQFVSPFRSAATAIAGAAVLLVSGVWASCEAARIRISHQWSAQTDARDRAARVFAAEIQKRAPGIAVTVHPGSELGIGPLEQYDALVDGRIEAAIFPLFYISPQIPEVSVTLLPGVPATIEQAAQLKGSEFHKRLQAVVEAKGFRILSWWWLKGGMVSIDDDIGSPDDMQGVHVRSGDALFDLMFAKAGAVPMVMPSTQIVEEMRAGRLNVAQASLETLLSMKMQTVARSAVIGGNALYISLHPLMISTKVWAGLNEAERKAVEAAADVADRAFVEAQTTIEAQVQAAFDMAGVKRRAMPYAEYERWLRIAQQTSWIAYSKQSAASGELLRALLTSLMQSKPGKP